MSKYLILRFNKRYQPEKFHSVPEKDIRWMSGTPPDLGQHPRLMVHYQLLESGAICHGAVLTKTTSSVPADTVKVVVDEMNSTLALDPGGAISFFEDVSLKMPKLVEHSSMFGSWANSSVMQEPLSMEEFLGAQVGEGNHEKGGGDGGQEPKEADLRSGKTKGNQKDTGNTGKNEKKSTKTNQNNSKKRGTSKRKSGDDDGSEDEDKRAKKRKLPIDHETSSESSSGSDTDSGSVRQGEEKKVVRRRRSKELKRLSGKRKKKREEWLAESNEDVRLLTLLDVESRLVENQKIILKMVQSVTTQMSNVQEFNREVASEFRKLANLIPAYGKQKDSVIGKSLPFQTYSDLYNGCLSSAGEIEAFVSARVPIDQPHYVKEVLHLLVGPKLSKSSSFSSPESREDAGGERVRMGFLVNKLPPKFGEIVKKIVEQNKLLSQDMEHQLFLARKYFENGLTMGRCERACLLADVIRGGRDEKVAKAAALTIIYDLSKSRGMVNTPLPPLENTNEIEMWNQRYEDTIRKAAFPALRMPLTGPFNPVEAVEAALPGRQTIDDLADQAPKVREGKGCKVMLFKGI